MNYPEFHHIGFKILAVWMLYNISSAQIEMVTLKQQKLELKLELIKREAIIKPLPYKQSSTAPSSEMR
jgi:hypothetical protein